MLDRLTGSWGRGAVIGVPMVFLLLVFLLPFLVVGKISLSEMEGVVFKDLMTWADGAIHFQIKVDNYLSLAEDSLYVQTYLSSLGFAALTTVICLLLAYPFAYFLARSLADQRPALLMLVMLPFWTSFLLRVYAWKMLLADAGVFNNLALAAGLIDEPVKMMNTPFSMVLGMVYTYLPFMILPLYANLAKMDLRVGIKAGQRQIEVVVAQGIEFHAQHCIVPACQLCGPVVTDHQRAPLGGCQVIEDDHRDEFQPQLLRSGPSAMTSNNDTVGSAKNRICKSKFDNRCRDLSHLLSRVGARIA